MESSDDAMVSWSVDGTCTSWNAGAERLYGDSAEEMIGRNVMRPREGRVRLGSWVPAGAPDALPDVLRRVAGGERVGPFESRRLRKDGRSIDLSFLVSAIRDGSGTLLGLACVARDITHRLAADKALRESEERFRLLVEGVVDYAIFGLDPGGRVTTWNSGAEIMKGYQSLEIIGRHFSVFYGPEDLTAGVPAASLLTAQREGSFETEGRRVRKDGSTFWASVVITALFDGDGGLRGFAKVIRDITERRAADEALRHSEDYALSAAARLAAVVDSSDDPIMTWSSDGVFTSWNGAAERLFGYRADEMVGRKRSDMALTVVPAGCADELIDFSPRRYETQRICKDQTVVDVLMTVSPIYDAAGTSIGTAVVARDITGSKTQERVLADERRRLRDAQAIGHVGSWERDLTTDVMTWSDTLFDLYGIERGAPHGDYISGLDRVDPGDRDVLATAVTACVDTGTPIHVRYRRTRDNDGELRWFELRGERIWEDGRVARLGGAVADVTELVLAARDLEKARDLALEASRQKSAFLATMSHEIRTPMNAVIGMTGLLLDTRLSDDQLDFVETVRSSGENLLGIINDILDFSKIEAGGLELEQRAFDLRSCVEDALDLVAVTSSAKGLELAGHVDTRSPSHVVGDVTRLRQVLVNLLSNAVKFTAHGEVVLTVEPVPQTNGEAGLRFAVTDTGIGISADALANLFESFSQVDASTTRNYGGTGLGLAISKRLVEAMGGTLAVASVAGAGSTFSFTVSLAAVPRDPETTTFAAAAGLAGQSALVVDDNPTNLRILRLQLEGWGMLVTEAASGAAAMSLVDARSHFDVAVLDMKMAEMTGADLAEKLRASPHTRLVPIVLLSSRMDRPAGHPENLFSAVLTKPVRMRRLQDSLRDALRPDSATSAPNAPESTIVAPRAAMRVLLAEDNAVNQRLGKLMLTKLGHHVDVVGNGLEAADAVRLVPYDVVLMDVEMPETDGLEATRLIRRDLTTSKQPQIVALTASALLSDRQACTDAGMDDYLTKPIRLQDLDAALTKAACAQRDR